MIAPEERVLDWAPKHDIRSLSFPARELFRRTKINNVTWRAPVVPLDQGREGACVGFGWTHEALTTPVRVDFAELANKSLPTDPTQFALSMYRDAQRIDEWAGEAYSGTSVNAGAKVMRERGLLHEWRWAFGIDDVMLSLLNLGPVVLGVNWYEGMYYANGGLVDVSGQHVGGHCLLANALRVKGTIFPDEEAIGWVNSWGPGYGRMGRAWIRKSQLASLLSQQGEAAVPVRRSYGR